MKSCSNDVELVETMCWLNDCIRSTNYIFNIISCAFNASDKLVCTTQLTTVFQLFYSYQQTLNAYFLTPEREDWNLLCSLDSCDVHTPFEFDFLSPDICWAPPATPSLGAAARTGARLLRTSSLTSVGNTSVLWWPAGQQRFNIASHTTRSANTILYKLYCKRKK